FVVVIGKFVHRKKHAAMNWLQTVAHVGQSSPDNNAHGVIQIRLFEFVFDIDGENFFCDFAHECRHSLLSIAQKIGTDRSALAQHITSHPWTSLAEQLRAAVKKRRCYHSYAD